MQSLSLLLTIAVLLNAQWAHSAADWGCQAVTGDSDQWWALRCNSGEVECFSLDGQTCASSPTGRDCSLLAMYQSQTGRPIPVRCESDTTMDEPGHPCRQVKATVCPGPKISVPTSFARSLVLKVGASAPAVIVATAVLAVTAVVALLAIMVVASMWLGYTSVRTSSWRLLPTEDKEADLENRGTAKVDIHDLLVLVVTP